MRAEYVIGGCIVLASLIFGAKDLYSIRQQANVLGTTAGLVRLGQVNSEKTTIHVKLYNDDGVVFETDGTPDDISLSVKNTVQSQFNAVNKANNYGKDKALVFEKASFTKDVTLEMTSNILYVSEHQPLGFTLSLETRTKPFKKGDKMSQVISEIEPYKNLVISKSEQLSFM